MLVGEGQAGLVGGRGVLEQRAHVGALEHRGGGVRVSLGVRRDDGVLVVRHAGRELQLEDLDAATVVEDIQQVLAEELRRPHGRARVVGRAVGLDAVVADLARELRIEDVEDARALAVEGHRQRRFLDVEVMRRAVVGRRRRLRRVDRRVPGRDRLHAIRRGGRGVQARLTAPRVRQVGDHELAVVGARVVELLLGAEQDVPVLDATGVDLLVRRAQRVVHEDDVRAHDAGHAATGDEDRVPRAREARRVGLRVAIAAARGVAADTAATGDPGDALSVDLDVMRVVGDAVVAVQVDRRAEDLRLVRVAHVGDPHGATVTAAARRARAEPVEVGATGGAAGPQEVAVIDAGRRMARRQLDEIADRDRLARVGVGDDEDAGRAARGGGVAVAGRPRHWPLGPLSHTDWPWRGSTDMNTRLRSRSMSMSSPSQKRV